MLNIRRYASLKRFIVPLLLGAVAVAPMAFGVSSIYAATAPPEGAVKTRNASSNGGHKYVVTQDFGTLADTGSAPKRSVLRIFENGKELGPAHTMHADIGNIGMGRFSHWGGSDGTRSVSNLYFSASDNTNPRTNGRMYTYRIQSQSTLSPVPVPNPAVVPAPAPVLPPAVVPAPAPVLSPAVVPAPTPVPTPAIVPAPEAVVVPVPVPAPTPTQTVIDDRVFYVSPSGSDSNPGTLNAPWRTIKVAAMKLTPGYTAILMDGTYEESSIQFAFNGTAGNPITIRAQNKWKAILSSISGCEAAFSINHSYIAIEDLRISVSPRNVACTVYTSKNGAIRAWNSLNPTPTQPSSGSQGFSARGLLIDYSAARSTGIKSNQDFSLVENNVIHSELEGFNSYGTIFRNNVIHDGGPNGTHILGKGGMRNFQVYNNVVHITRDGTTGILLGGGPFAYWDRSTNIECFNCVAYNNVVINEGPGATNVGLLGMRGAKDSAFFNNVAIGGTIFLMPSDPSGAYPPPGFNVNPTFKNNIVTCKNGALTGGFGWNGFYTGTLILDSNNFHGCSSGMPAQTNAISGDPKFVNPTSDWRLQAGSPALGTGTQTSMRGFDGQSIDVSRNKDGTIRTAPVNLGIY